MFSCHGKCMVSEYSPGGSSLYQRYNPNRKNAPFLRCPCSVLRARKLVAGAMHAQHNLRVLSEFSLDLVTISIETDPDWCHLEMEFRRTYISDFRPSHPRTSAYAVVYPILNRCFWPNPYA